MQSGNYRSGIFENQQLRDRAILGGAYTEPQLQDELWRDNPDCAFADSFNPTGKAEPTKGGFRLTGRWGFQSGLPWSEWSSVGAITPFEAGAPPEYLMLFLPKRDYRIVDDWHTVGLRGWLAQALKLTMSLSRAIELSASEKR